MLRKVPFWAVVLTGAQLVFAGLSEAATRTWDGGGGADTNWNTAANWSSNSIPGSGDTARFNNTSTNNCTINVAVNVQGIDIQSTYTGTITQGSGNSVTVGTSDFVMAAGTFTGGNSTIDCNDRFTLSGGTFTSTTGTLSVEGNLTISGGTFTHNSGTVTLDTSAATIDIGLRILNHLTIAKGGNNLAVTGTVDVNGNLTVTTANQINTGTIAVAGNVTTSDTSVTGSATVRFDGTGNQTLGTGSGTGELPRVTIDKSAGTLTIQDTIEVTGDWTYTAGTVNAGTSTVKFQTNSLTVNSGAMSFNHVTLDMGNTDLTVTGTMDVNGDLTLTTVRNISGTIAVAGNVTSADTSVGGTGVIKLDGTGSQTITANSSADFPNGNFTIDKAGGTASLGGAVTFGSLLKVTNGTFSQGTGSNLTASSGVTVDAGGTFLNTGTGDLTLGGNVSNSGTIQMDSNGASSGGDDILVRSTSGANRTWSGAGTFTLTDLDVARMTAGATPGVIEVVSGTDSGNNVNWLFTTQDPVLHLKMDDGSGTAATDSSANANHGTLLGGTTWSTDRAPLTVSNPYSNSFDGVDDSISVPSASPLNTSLAFTISAWIKPNAVAAGTIVAKWSAAANKRQYALRLSGGQPVLEVSTSGQSGTVRSVTASGSLTAGAWYHVAGRYSGDEMKVYIDAAGTSASFSLAGAFTSDPALRIGRDEGGTYFNGLIDEVRHYNRALTDSEISTLAQRDSTPPAAPTGLVLTANSEHTDITAVVTAPADSDVSELIWRYNSADGDTTVSYPSTHTSGTAFGAGTTSGVTPSSAQQITASPLTQLKTYGVAVWAKDAAGNVSAAAAKASLYLGPLSPRLVVTAASSATSAEAATSVVITVTAKDANSNVITGYAGPYSLTWTPTGGSAATLVSSSTSGWSSGVTTATVEIGGAQAGPGTFQATDNSTNNLTAGSLTFTWYPSSFVVSTPTLIMPAGHPFPLTVTAKDKNGLTVTRYAGTAALSVTYEEPSTGTRTFLKTSFLPAEFVSGAAQAALHYLDAGRIKIHVKDTTYVSGKTIAGSSEAILFLPALFSVKISAPPARLTKFYVDQPFDVTVQALAEDKVTVTPNYAGAITLTGTGASTPLLTYTFVPATDQGVHTFAGLKASSAGSLVIKAQGGSAQGTSDPVGIRAAALVINPASGAPGTLSSSAFILLDTDGAQVVSEDDSTQFRLILESPSAGVAASSAAADSPLTVKSGVASFTITKADAGDVVVRAVVQGFSMPVLPGTFRWITGTSQAGGRSLNQLQFEQNAAARFRPVFPAGRFREGGVLPPGLQGLSGRVKEGTFTFGPPPGARFGKKGTPPPGAEGFFGPGGSLEGGAFGVPNFGGDFFGGMGPGFSAPEGGGAWFMGPSPEGAAGSWGQQPESFEWMVPDWSAQQAGQGEEESLDAPPP